MPIRLHLLHVSDEFPSVTSPLRFVTFVRAVRPCSSWSRTKAAQAIRVMAAGSRPTLRRATALGLLDRVAQAWPGVLVAEVGRGRDVHGGGEPVRGVDQPPHPCAGGLVQRASALGRQVEPLAVRESRSLSRVRAPGSEPAHTSPLIGCSTQRDADSPRPPTAFQRFPDRQGSPERNPGEPSVADLGHPGLPGLPAESSCESSRRIQKRLGHLSPITFEEKHRANQATGTGEPHSRKDVHSRCSTRRLPNRGSTK